MDDLERRIRAARPVSGHRDLPLTDRAKRELADLILTGTEAPAQAPVGSRTRGSRRRALRGWMLAAAATAVALAIVIPLATIKPAPAHAATPPILTVSPLSGTAPEQLRSLSAIAATQPSSPAAGQAIQISVEAWTLSTDDDGIARSSVVVPEHYAITRSPDGTLSQVITAGTPIGPTAGATPTPGTVLHHETWPKGKDAYRFPTSAPTDPKKVAAFLAAPEQETPPLSADASIDEIRSLLLEQQLTPAQASAILTYLADLPGITLAGTTTDRLGRPGIMFSAVEAADPSYTQHLVIDPGTGRVLTIERTYSGTNRTDIPSPSVVDYYAWH